MKEEERKVLIIRLLAPSPQPTISSALSSNGPFLSQLTRPTYHVFPIALHTLVLHTFPSFDLVVFSTAVWTILKRVGKISRVYSLFPSVTSQPLAPYFPPGYCSLTETSWPQQLTNQFPPFFGTLISASSLFMRFFRLIIFEYF